MARTSGVSNRLNREGSRRAFNLSFLTDAFAELRRVTWPTRRETTRLTWMVIAVSVTVGIFLGFIDLGFSRLFDILLGA